MVMMIAMMIVQMITIRCRCKLQIQAISFLARR